MLPIAPSTYYEHRARQADPDRRPAREQRDEALRPKIERVYEENIGGLRGRQGLAAARPGEAFPWRAARSSG